MISCPGADDLKPLQLGLAEACIALWSRALASATVEPASMALSGLSAPVLALAGRMLATRGNAVFLIEVRGSGVVLHPAAGWDPRGGFRPESRRYRLTMSGPDGTATRNVHGDGVLHFAVNQTESEWWRGRGPLWRSRATANLAAAIERNMTGETAFRPLRLIKQDGVIPSGNTDKTMNALRERVKSGGVGFFPYDFTGPVNVGADPSVVMEALRSNAGNDICSAFGCWPTLFSPAGDGSGQREAWRRFWAGTVTPLGRIVETELRRKLDPSARLSFDALRASDEDGRSRAISRRANAAKIFADMGFERAEALRLAGIGEQDD